MARREAVLHQHTDVLVQQLHAAKDMHERLTEQQRALDFACLFVFVFAFILFMRDLTPSLPSAHILVALVCAFLDNARVCELLCRCLAIFYFYNFEAYCLCAV